MAIAHCTNALYGWSTGYYFVSQFYAVPRARDRNDNLLSAKLLAFQFSTVSDIICSLAAKIKPLMADRVNRIAWVASFLSLPAIALLGYVGISGVTDHVGKVFYVAVVIGAIALIYFNAPVYGGFLLGAFVFQEINRRGLIQEDVSVRINQFMPAVSAFGLCLGGGWLNRLFAAQTVIDEYFPHLYVNIQNRLDSFFHDALELKGPSIEEYEAPLLTKKELAFNEIMDILKGKSAVQVNPAHCSKIVADDLPEYESKVLNALELKRQSIINSVHKTDEKRNIRHLSLGLLPMSREGIKLADIFEIPECNNARCPILYLYSESIIEVVYFLGPCEKYVREIINNNPNLSQAQKDQIDRSNGYFYRLALVMMGVLRTW